MFGKDEEGENGYDSGAKLEVPETGEGGSLGMKGRRQNGRRIRARMKKEDLT